MERKPDLRLVKFGDFEPVMTLITLPSNCILHRGQKITHPILTSRPAYYTYNVDVARGYGHVQTYVTTRQLVLLDLRFIRGILQEFMQTATGFDQDTPTLALAYGTCTLNTQIRLLKMRYRDTNVKTADMVASMQQYLDNRTPERAPLDVQGVRVAETTNDREALMLLKSMFRDTTVDGYIAPNMQSPYHIEKTDQVHSAELVLFDPSSSGLRVMSKEERKHEYSTVDLDMMICTDYKAVHQPLFWNSQKVRIPSVTSRKSQDGGARKQTKGLIFDPCALERMSETEYRALEERTRHIGPRLLDTRVHIPDSMIGRCKRGPVTMSVSPWLNE